MKDLLATSGDEPATALPNLEAYRMPAGLEAPRVAFEPGAPISEAEKALAKATVRNAQNGASEWLDSIHAALIHPSPDGYTVQFPGVGEGRTRHFRGVEHGSMKDALYAARDWRDSQVATLEDCVNFPRGERITWSDGEIDAVAERAAWLEQAVKAGWLPNRGYQLLHYVRVAIVQVLPWNRWRKMWQSRSIPYDVVARLPGKRREAAARMKDFLRRAKVREAALDTVGSHMPVAEAPVAVPPPKETPPPPPVSKPMAPAPSESKPAPDANVPPEINEGGPVLGLIERYILVAMEARVGPFMRDVFKRVDWMSTRLVKMEQDVAIFLEDAAKGLVPMSPAGVAMGSATLSEEVAREVLAQIGEFKVMQDMLHEELTTVRRLSGEIEDGRDGVDTRLRELEATVFRMAKGGGAVSVRQVGGSASPIPERPRLVPVIAIMGPLSDQFRQIRERVGNAAELVYLDNKNSSNAVTVPDRVEWAINNRFGTHAQEGGLKAALGTDRVIHIASGGVSSMVRAVLEVVERVNREGGAK